MKNRQMLLLFTVMIFIMAAVHFSLTTIYSLGTLPIPEKAQAAAYRYSVPFFHQNWKMFAPSVPEYSNQLEYRYKANGKWSAWLDATGSHGYGSHSRMEYVEQTINDGLSWQIANNMYVVNKTRQLDRVMESFDYGRAVYYILQMCERDGNKAQLNDSLQLRLGFRFTPKPGNAPTQQFSFLEFPPFLAP
jgi:hypothetical protein